MLEEKVVCFESGGSFSIIGAEIFVDQDDFPGVVIAASNLSQDFTRVTGRHCNPLVKTRPRALQPRLLSMMTKKWSNGDTLLVQSTKKMVHLPQTMTPILICKKTDQITNVKNCWALRP